MTNDTSTDAVEAFIQGPLKEAVLSEGMPTTPEDTQDVYEAIGLLRALAAERDALRAKNARLREALGEALDTMNFLLTEVKAQGSIPDEDEELARGRILRATLEEKNDDE